METIDQRADYITEIIKAEKPSDRRFASCFENGDGDELLRELLIRATNDDVLEKNLPHYIAKDCIDRVNLSLTL